MKRTLENCKLVKQHGKPKQYNGVCEGFAKSEMDDEPCEVCKSCKLHYLNKEVTSMSELKRCPFCGGEAELFHDDYGKIGVYCKNGCVYMGVSLECGVELVDGWRAEFKTVGEAITAWNRRTPDMGNPTTENTPLSIEELQGMDGQPVWLVTNKEPPVWAFVVIDHDEFISFNCSDGSEWEFDIYGDSEGGSGMRLIDADAVLEKQTEAEGYGGWFAPVVLVEDIDNATTIEPVQWISVKDRLPTAREDVLVVAYWHEKYQVLMAWYAPNGEVWHVTTMVGDKADLTITHWMQLPKPPNDAVKMDDPKSQALGNLEDDKEER